MLASGSPGTLPNAWRPHLYETVSMWHPNLYTPPLLHDTRCRPVSISLPQHYIQCLDRLAQQQSCSRSEAIRRLIDTASDITRDTPGVPNHSRYEQLRQSDDLRQSNKLDPFCSLPYLRRELQSPNPDAAIPSESSSAAASPQPYGCAERTSDSTCNLDHHHSQDRQTSPPASASSPGCDQSPCT